MWLFLSEYFSDEIMYTLCIDVLFMSYVSVCVCACLCVIMHFSCFSVSQAQVEAAPWMARCLQTGMCGSQSHARSVFVTVAQWCAMRSSARTQQTARTLSSPMMSAAPSAPMMVLHLYLTIPHNRLHDRPSLFSSSSSPPHFSSLLSVAWLNKYSDTQAHACMITYTIHTHSPLNVLIQHL